MSNHDCKAIVIGVTGGIACGKSEAGRILEEMGFAVCDADRVAHDLMRKGTPTYWQVVAHFGPRILADDGEIARPELARIVFGQPEERSVLDRLVHPAVRHGLESWMAERKSEGLDAAAQVPLLYESGMETLGWDAILCVVDGEERVLGRLARRGLGREDALERIRAQMPLREKAARADVVVQNNGTLDDFKVAMRQAVECCRMKG